jgi:hypothetical protein
MVRSMAGLVMGERCGTDPPERDMPRGCTRAPSPSRACMDSACETRQMRSAQHAKSEMSDWWQEAHLHLEAQHLRLERR